MVMVISSFRYVAPGRMASHTTETQYECLLSGLPQETRFEVKMKSARKAHGPNPRLTTAPGRLGLIGKPSLLAGSRVFRAGPIFLP